MCTHELQPCCNLPLHATCTCGCFSSINQAFTNVHTYWNEHASQVAQCSGGCVWWWFYDLQCSMHMVCVCVLCMLCCGEVYNIYCICSSRVYVVVVSAVFVLWHLFSLWHVVCGVVSAVFVWLALHGSQLCVCVCVCSVVRLHSIMMVYIYVPIAHKSEPHACRYELHNPMLYFNWLH